MTLSQDSAVQYLSGKKLQSILFVFNVSIIGEKKIFKMLKTNFCGNASRGQILQPICQDKSVTKKKIIRQIPNLRLMPAREITLQPISLDHQRWRKDTALTQGASTKKLYEFVTSNKYPDFVVSQCLFYCQSQTHQLGQKYQAGQTHQLTTESKNYESLVSYSTGP